MIKFNQNAWLKAYIDMNTDLKKTKNVFDKDLFRLMKNAVFWKNNGKCGKTEILNLAQHKEEGTT